MTLTLLDKGNDGDGDDDNDNDNDVVACDGTEVESD